MPAPARRRRGARRADASPARFFPGDPRRRQQTGSHCSIVAQLGESVLARGTPTCEDRCEECELRRGDQLLRVRNGCPPDGIFTQPRRVLAAGVQIRRSHHRPSRRSTSRIAPISIQPDALALLGVVDAEERRHLAARGLLALAEQLGREGAPERVVPVLGRLILLVRRLGGREADRSSAIRGRPMDELLLLAARRQLDPIEVDELERVQAAIDQVLARSAARSARCAASGRRARRGCRAGRPRPRLALPGCPIS